MYRYKITISYDGTGFAGWQVQKKNQAIQPLIQKAIETILRHPIGLTGSGRTDAGVHALAQVAHFDSPIDCDLKRFLYSLNGLLPLQIAIHQIEKVPNSFHARYSAISKTYHYHLHLDKARDPFTHLYRHHPIGKCDLSLLADAIPSLVGTHDFTAFANLPLKESVKKDPIRTLKRIDLVEEKGGIRLEFEANGFLYKMVRNLMGTLLEVAAEKLSASKIPEIFESKDRKKAGSAAPAQGLFMIKVNYAPIQSLGIFSSDSK